MMLRRHGTAVRLVLVFVLITMIPLTLVRSDVMRKRGDDGERLYFPSGVFLVESSLGFRSAFADYLWFRFIQYFGSYAKGHHDLRYFDVLLESVTRLDPRFIEAYNFGSLVAWSELGDFDKAVDILKQGVVHNPDTAELPFKIAFIYYVFFREYELAGMWFEAAAHCSDATDREARFAAFARYRAGDDRVSLELWKDLKQNSPSAEMQKLADKMIRRLETKLWLMNQYGEDFIGPIPEEI
jgi:tetratricopeptide (TPR) repeat protein